MRLSEMVKKIGYSCEYVNNGEKSLASLQNKYYDFIILNLHIDGEIQGTFILRWLQEKDILQI